MYTGREERERKKQGVKERQGGAVVYIISDSLEVFV